MFFFKREEVVKYARIAILFSDFYYLRENLEGLPKKFQRFLLSFFEEGTEMKIESFCVSRDLWITVYLLPSVKYGLDIWSLVKHSSQKQEDSIEEIMRFSRIYFDKFPSSPLIKLTEVKPHIFITGQVPTSECLVERIDKQRWAGVYPVIIRFSRFFPKASTYTKKSPLEVGYNLDMPKRIDLLTALLFNEDFLRAIYSYDSVGIEESVRNFNECYDTCLKVLRL